jgi:hypothetical protein
MVEAQEAPRARPVEIGRLERRLELARLSAARDRAALLCSFDSPVQPSLLHAVDPVQSSTKRSPLAAEGQRLDSSLRLVRIVEIASSVTSIGGTSD